MAQIKYAIMLWVNDNNKMSVYHLKYVTKPKKPWNEFQRGDSSRKLTNNLAVKQIMQVHKKGKIVRFTQSNYSPLNKIWKLPTMCVDVSSVCNVHTILCGWTSIILPPRKKHREYETKTDVKPKFWLYQKVTSAELAGLIHFMRSKLYISISQSGSWHILNRMKWDPSRIPVYSDWDPAS